jgi:hypothetical protein
MIKARAANNSTGSIRLKERLTIGRGDFGNRHPAHKES